MMVNPNQVGPVYSPDEIERLDAAYRSALVEIRGRPEWRRHLGVDEIKGLIASTILAHARAGLDSDGSLSALAVAAVQTEYMSKGRI